MAPLVGVPVTFRNVWASTQADSDAAPSLPIHACAIIVWLNPNTWPADNGILSRTNLRHSSHTCGWSVTLELLFVDSNQADGRRTLSRPRRCNHGSTAAPDGFVAPCIGRQRQGLQLDTLFRVGRLPLSDTGIVMVTVHCPTPQGSGVIHGPVDVEITLIDEKCMSDAMCPRCLHLQTKGAAR